MGDWTHIDDHSVNSMKTNLPPLPWLAWTPGERVVVRYKSEDGIHDALGTLVETTPHYVVVEAKRGLVKVPAHQMITGKKVSPNLK